MARKYGSRTREVTVSSFIHPTAVIYPGVELGQDVWVGPLVVIGTPAELPGQWVGEGEVTVGDRTVIREHSCLQGPSVVGSDCYLMDRVHIAHHCKVGNHVTIAPGTVLAGTVTIGDKAWVGVNVSIHQRLSIGEGVMVGMGAVVTHDIPPWETWYGNPAKFRGHNTEGMRRHGQHS